MPKLRFRIALALLTGFMALGCGMTDPGPAPDGDPRYITQGGHVWLPQQQSTPEFARMMALHDAVSRGDTEAVRRFLQNGVPVEVRDVEGNTPLMHSAFLGDLSLMELLLSEGADPDAQNLLEGTALMYAARENQVRLVRRLVQAGASVDARNDRGQTALYQAASRGHAATVKVLLLAGAKVGKPSFEAAEAAGHTEVVELLRTAERVQ